MKALLTPAPANYSVTRLLQTLLNPEAHADCPELAHSKSVLEPLVGRPSRGNGAFLPFVASGLDTNTGAAGRFTTQVDVSRDIIASLRALSLLARAGMQVFTGLKFGFSLAVQTSGTAAAWVGDNLGLGDVAEVNPVFSARVFNPRPLLSTVSVSKQLLTQASPDLEAYLRADIGRALAEAIDIAGVNGLGTANQPTGLLKTSGIGDLPLGTNGGTLTGDNVCALEKLVGDGNANVSAWLASPALRKKLRQTPRFASGTNEPLWRDDGTILGSPAFASTSIPINQVKGTSSDCSPLITGDFSNLVTALWALEVVVDPYARKKNNMTEISVFTMADLGVLRPSCFAACQDSRP
jgi:HK97 family phage major capsid protein